MRSIAMCKHELQDELFHVLLYTDNEAIMQRLAETEYQQLMDWLATDTDEPIPETIEQIIRRLIQMLTEEPQ